MADPRDPGESPDPFGTDSELAGHPGPRDPLMSRGFCLHHATLGWRQVFDRPLRPLNLTPAQFLLLSSADGWPRRPASCRPRRKGPITSALTGFLSRKATPPGRRESGSDLGPLPRVPPTGFEPVPPP